MEEIEITIEEAGYPKLLKEVMGAPEQLFVKGDSQVLMKPMMAVVGSREMTKRGEEETRIIVKNLVERGYVIVSGLAKGIDRVAHETTLECGGETVAVLAHGLSMIYPKEHEELALSIIKEGGALISELPSEAKPNPSYFLERNRIIVGMSQALFVIEAQLKSGSLSSANHAAEMGRLVFAVPGSPGTDALIRDGAESLG